MPRYPINLPALDPLEVPAGARSIYPKPLDEVVRGRGKRRLGDVLGLKQFGVNLTTLAAGSATALRHYHAACDEFVYVLDGEPTLVTDKGEQVLSPGMCAGFAAGKKDGHHFVNRGDRPVLLLEVGTKVSSDSIGYPDDKLYLYQDENGHEFGDKPYPPFGKAQPKGKAKKAAPMKKKKR